MEDVRVRVSCEPTLHTCASRELPHSLCPASPTHPHCRSKINAVPTPHTCLISELPCNLSLPSPHCPCLYPQAYIVSTPHTCANRELSRGSMTGDLYRVILSQMLPPEPDSAVRVTQ